MMTTPHKDREGDSKSSHSRINSTVDSQVIPREMDRTSTPRTGDKHGLDPSSSSSSLVGSPPKKHTGLHGTGVDTTASIRTAIEQGASPCSIVGSKSADQSNSVPQSMEQNDVVCEISSHDDDESNNTEGEEDYSSEQEDEEDYCKGGYHRIRIGDAMGNQGRYIIQDKLGWGHFSTVHLAWDSTLKRQVALKIVKSAENYSDAALDEIELLKCVTKHQKHPYYSCLVAFHDSFRFRGPNGNHVVLVFEVAGRNLLSYVRANKHKGLPASFVKGVMYSSLKGLAYLHDVCKIIHTDIKPENILVGLKSQSKVDLNQPKVEPNGVQEPEILVRSLSDVSISHRSSIASPNPPPSARNVLAQQIKTCPIQTCKIVDLGNACFTHHHFTSDIQTRQYRSPEVILGAHYDTSVDIWSLGCVCFELLTGDFLFDPKAGKAFNRDDDHLAQIIELIGHFPKSAIRGEFSGEFFNRKGELRAIKHLKKWSLSDVLKLKYHYSEQDANATADFMLAMIQIVPRSRKTAAELLRHPWLEECRREDEAAEVRKK